jgi:3-methyladenine DNA glycosylase/8-oxoguanine DNA glycosylase
VRPVRAPYERPSPPDVSGLSAVASASLRPRGAGYDPARLRRRPILALRGGPDAIVIAVAAVPRIGEVRVRVLSNGALSSDDVERAIVAARGHAAVDDDPTDFVTMVKHHAILGPLVRRVDPRISTTPTVFESLAVAIIEQLVTGFEARASIRRLWRVAGMPVTGSSLVAPPTAAAVRRVPMWKMHALGIGSRRAVTLHDAAGRGDAVERLREVSPEVAMQKLESLRGIGPWTSNAVARNAFAWPDAVPVGDFHAPFVIPAALGSDVELTRDDPAAADRVMLEMLEPFRPHRARVALLLEGLATGRRSRPLPRVDRHRREPWRY